MSPNNMESRRYDEANKSDMNAARTPRIPASKRHVFYNWSNPTTQTKASSNSGVNERLTSLSEIWKRFQRISSEHGAQVTRVQTIHNEISDAAKARFAEIEVGPDNAIPPEYTAIYTANHDSGIVESYRIKYIALQESLEDNLILASKKIETAEGEVKILGEDDKDLKDVLKEYNQLLENRRALVESFINKLQQSVKVLTVDSKTDAPESPGMLPQRYGDSKDIPV